MDKRSYKIIYLSQCLLNQNLRFPGIAVEKGAINNLLSSLMEHGIGIETLPCLERLGWGGVRRKTFYKYFPKVSKNINSRKFPIIKFFLKLWVRKYKKLCKKEAKKVVNQIKDYLESGYSILGIVSTNDSPTCGFSKTMDLIELSGKYKELGIKSEFFENPTLAKIKDLIPNLCQEGSGYFISEIVKQVKRFKLDINFIGFDIWNNPTEETEKVLNNLEL